MSQPLAAPAANPAAALAFRIVLNIDISGSMERQLDGVKAYCADLASLCEDLDVPMSLAVITFTEDQQRPYVSLNEFQDMAAARTFVENLDVACPPGPDAGIAGGGGPPLYKECQKAALYKMTELDPSVPTISFHITDEGPNLRRHGDNPGAQAELAWLQAKGLEPQVASDAQRVYAKVLDHFNGSLVQNVVYYKDDPLDTAFYGSLAQRTGGMLMQPNTYGTHILAGGLLHIVKTLLSAFQPEGPPAPAAPGVDAEGDLVPLEGFLLYDVAQLPEVETEEAELGSVHPGDTAIIFKIAMQRMLAVCGRKWTKRAIGMCTPAQQLTFVWRAARYIATPPADPSAAAAELGALLDLREQILGLLPEQDRGHFSISNQDLCGRLRDWYQGLAAAAAAGGGGDGQEAPTSAITLATVGEALAEDATWEDVLADVAKLLLGYGLRVQLPVDRDGKPDFADSWSSRMEQLGCDTITSADFLALIGDKPTAQGLTNRQEHNAFLVTASPSDPLASLVLRLASGTQVLNYVTGVCLGAKGFLPNLYPGMASATLVSLLDQQNLTQFQWRQAQELLHCLSTLHHAPARSLLEGLKVGRANPEDPISKFVAAAARLKAPSAAKGPSSNSSSQQLKGVLPPLLQEWLLGMVQRKYGRKDEEGSKEYLRVLRTYLPSHLLLDVPAHMTPTQQLHPLEKPLTAAVATDLLPGWEATAYQRVAQGVPRGGGGGGSGGGPQPLAPQGARQGGWRAQRSLAPLNVIQRFERAAQRLVTLLLGAPVGPPPPDSSSSSKVHPSKDTSKPAGPNSSGATAVPSKGSSNSAGPNSGVATTVLSKGSSDPADANSSGATTVPSKDTSSPAAKKDTPMEEVEEGTPAPAANSTTPSSGHSSVVSLSSVWPGWQEAVVQALLLRWRKARYTSQQVEQAQGEGSSAAGAAPKAPKAGPTTAWTLVDPLPPTGELLLQRLVEVHADDIKQWRAARLAAAESALTQAAVQLIQQHPEDEQALSAALGQLFLQLTPGAGGGGRPEDAPRGPLAVLLDQTARLERKAVPALLRALAKAAPNASFSSAPLAALVTGDWTTMPPSTLKKAGEVLVAVEASGRADLQEALAARDKCARDKRANMHGHTASLPYPGPDGWSEEYAAARIKQVEGIERKGEGYKRKVGRVQLYLAAMKQYTGMAAAAREAAAASGSAAQVAAVEALLRGTDDAHELPAVLAKVEEVLGKELPLPPEQRQGMLVPKGSMAAQVASKEAREAAWQAKGHIVTAPRRAKTAKRPRAKTATDALRCAKRARW